MIYGVCEGCYRRSALLFFFLFFSSRNSPRAAFDQSEQFYWPKRASAFQSRRSRSVGTRWWRRGSSAMRGSLGARTVTRVATRSAGSSRMQSAVTEIHPVAATATTPKTKEPSAGRHSPTLARTNLSALASRPSALPPRPSGMTAHAWTRGSVEQGSACRIARREEKFPVCVTQRWMRASGAVAHRTMPPASRQSLWRY